MAFVGSVKCTIEKAEIETDIYGAKTYCYPVNATCSIIKRNISNAQTTVRVDSGGTRGKGYEIVGYMDIMIDPSYNLKRGDKITVFDSEMRVESTMPVAGRKGCAVYVEVECSIFQSN